ncbi:hypothetical protein FQA47_008126 [Oryzias melastigma]|uniref:Uncharacterized protein n=1 Tax=Oryzias melastigma TaxID=30732 RepID=A0A834F6D9_ORYME|nr:hypothetical protein FQA47_018440 [Oryzias melastigma]KAF6728012.1 hypothetical protein FQA47_008126 [Oryzias melastigma]
MLPVQAAALSTSARLPPPHVAPVGRGESGCCAHADCAARILVAQLDVRRQKKGRKEIENTPLSTPLHPM